MAIVLAVDPGSNKCGVAVVSGQQGILHRAVVAKAKVVQSCRQLLEKYAVDAVIVGGSTGAAAVVKMLKQELVREIEVVCEEHTSELARERYFVENPPRGWRRLIPLGLQLPPVPIDDYAAVIMAEQYLQARSAGVSG